MRFLVFIMTMVNFNPKLCCYAVIVRSKNVSQVF